MGETIKTAECKEELDRMEEMTRRDHVLAIREFLDKNNKGAIKSTVTNYLKVLRNDPLLTGCLRYNLLTCRVDVVKPLWWNRETVALSEEAIDYFYIYLERNYSLCNDKMMNRAIRGIANSNKYHPVRELLNSLQWDGIPRIRYMIKKYLGGDDSDLTYECMLHFMLGAIRRVFVPGCKYEEMLCLVGGQGAGKSTFFRFLAIRDEWYSEDLKKLNDEKVFEKLRGHWIIEMSEMIAAINAKGIEEIKSFLSRQKETYRIPYQQNEEDRPRQCVFAGTTNTKRFLPFDRSGERRFLPVEVDQAKAEKHLLEDEAEARGYIIQAWAEAMDIYKNREYSMKFPEDFQGQLELHRQKFMQEDTISGLIQGWLDEYQGEYVCSQMIYKEALGHLDTPPKWATNEICEIMDMKISGWREGPSHRFTKEGYGTQRSWIRSASGVNEEDPDGFRPLPEEGQLTLPFD